MAAATDKFRKVARKFVGQVGAAGVADASVTTMALSSATGLPTDTGIDLVFGRVNSSGTKTPSLEETAVGVISGSNLTAVLRGEEGTAQAHGAGVVVENLITANGWNDIVDGILVGHNQDGTHKSGSVLTLPQINDTSSTHQYVVGVSELTADRTVQLPLLTGNDEFTFNAHAQVLTNKTLTLPQINDTSSDHQYVVGVSELTADRTVQLPLLTGNDEFAFIAHTQTLTNKRISPRVVTTASDTTAVIDVDVTDQYQLTAMAGATEFTLTGTPVAGQKLIVRLKDDGTGRALTWTGFTAVGVTLPTTTVASKVHYIGCIYNATAPRWEVVAVVQEA